MATWSTSEHLCGCACNLNGVIITHLIELDKKKITVEKFIQLLKDVHDYDNFEIIDWLRKYNNKEINIYTE